MSHPPRNVAVFGHRPTASRSHPPHCIVHLPRALGRLVTFKFASMARREVRVTGTREYRESYTLQLARYALRVEELAGLGEEARSGWVFWFSYLRVYCITGGAKGD